jgi:CRISPR-associated protein Csd1
VNLEKDIREIVDKLPPHLPKSLNLKSQGTFAVGYYHQAEARFKKALPSEAEAAATVND